MTTQLEFVELVIRDVLKFRGIQVVEFARPPRNGGRAVTLISGDGGTGKTCLVSTIRLALWGAEEYLRHPVPPDRRPPLLHRAAVLGSDPQASVRLTISVDDPKRPHEETWGITRIWRAAERDGASVSEDVRLEIEAGGQMTQLEGSDAEACIAAVFPRDNSPLVELTGSELMDLGGLGRADARLRARARDAVLHIARTEMPDRAWRGLAAPTIAFVDRATGHCRHPDCSPLVPGGRSGCGPVVLPGLRLRRPLEDASEVACLGTALAVAIAGAGAVQAPLVLDGPLVAVVPDRAAPYLDALGGLGPPQLLLTAHECATDDDAGRHWDAAQRVYLVEDKRTRGTGLLSEPLG